MVMARILWSLPVIAAVAMLLFVAPLMWSRDLGTYLTWLFFCVPTLLAVCAGLFIWSVFEKNTRRKQVALATLATIIGLFTAFWFVSKYAHDRLAFEFWYPSHRQMIEKLSHKDGIILVWDSWGMAGMDENAYLVSNPSDSIVDAKAASAWARSHNWDCSSVEVQRMRRGLYILTTDNCPLQ